METAPAGMRMGKNELRVQLRQRLVEISAELRKRKSHDVCDSLSQSAEFQRASTVMMYLSLPDEVDTDRAILKAWQMGKTVAVPRVSRRQRHMMPVRIDRLQTGSSAQPAGFRNPASGAPTAIEEIDLVVTPGLGFDRHGNRLGRGGSYYDEFFSNKLLRAKKCGLAFAEQVVDSIPVFKHDMPVDFLITDKELIYFDSNSNTVPK